MKQTLAILALSAFCAIAFAHPASDINASYSAQNQTVSISFDHPVENPSEHFIEGVEIRLNGRMIISQVNTAQDSETGGSFIYKIPNLRKNDVLMITLICSRAGKKTATMKMK